MIFQVKYSKPNGAAQRLVNTYSLDPSLRREYAEQIYRLTPGRPCLSWHNGLVKSHFVPGDNKVPWRVRARARTRRILQESPRVIFLCSVLCGYSTDETAKACQPFTSTHRDAIPWAPRAVGTDPSIPSRLPVIPLCETLLDLSWNKQAFQPQRDLRLVIRV